MTRFNHILIASALGLTLCGSSAVAQDGHDDRDRRDDHHQQYVRHDEWKKGEHIRHEDWDRGERVDYHHYHLHQPPQGYEWREVDGNYVLAAVATGVIASTIVASSVH